MAEPPYAEVKTNRRFERGWNILQSVIQWTVTAIVVAGLLGLFGTGLFSRADATTSGDPAVGPRVTIAYERILRRTVQTDLTIRFSDAAADQLGVSLPESFVREMDIVSTSPRSTTMRVVPDGVSYVFDVLGARSGTITMSMKPKSAGWYVSRFRVDGNEVALHQLVWP